MKLDMSLEYHLERFRAFDSLPSSVKKRMLADPRIFNIDWIDDCGLQSCVLSLGQTAMDMSGCQSPIEMMMFLALEKLRYAHSIIDIEVQKELICNGKKYRADFFIKYGEIYPDTVPCGAVVVECDGHDFHEKTKEQAARDRQRDRDMQSDNIAVMRFTGSEIYKDADRCAAEVYSFISKVMSR